MAPRLARKPIWRARSTRKALPGAQDEDVEQRLNTILSQSVRLCKTLGRRACAALEAWWSAPVTWMRLVRYLVAAIVAICVWRIVVPPATGNALRRSHQRLAPMAAAILTETMEGTTTHVSITTTRFADRVKGNTFTSHGLVFPEFLRPWVRFAEENDCLVTEGYEGIEHDLKPFKAIAPIDLSLLKHTTKLLKWVNYCRVRDGHMTCNIKDRGRVPPIDAGVLQYAHLLPNMDFLVNTEDGARLMTPGSPQPFYDWGRDTTLAARCTNDTNLLDLQGKHSMYLQDQPSRTSELLPVLSTSKVDGCHRDILLPWWLERTDPFVGAHLEPLPFTEWSDKMDVVKWDGPSTGATIRPDYKWWDSQRFRLVKKLDAPGYFGGDILSDAAFTENVQCELGEETCGKMCETYPCTSQAPQKIAFRNKYILDIDGNGQSHRYQRLLFSGSVILKGTVYRPWFAERVKPWVHYVPIDLSFNSLNNTVQWLHHNEDKAREIGRNARKLAQKQLRDIDADCYAFRLLLEYANLFKPIPY